MKKLLLFILALSLTVSVFSQENSSKDYKWLIGANTGAMYLSDSDTSGGMIMVDAMYSITDNFMLGAAVGLNFGDFEGEDVFVGARYYFGNIFLSAAYDLGDSDTGIEAGLGYGWDVADNVEFAPRLTHNFDMEVTALSIGFAIRF